MTLSNETGSGNPILDGSDPAPSALPEVVLYTKPGCHLCDVAKGILERVGRRIRFRLVTVNIEESADLQTRFGDQIPVIFVNGRKAFKYKVDPAILEKKLRQR